MRRTLTHLLAGVAALVCAAATLGAGPGAFADDIWGGVDCQQDPTRPTCVVIVVRTGEGGDGSGGGSVTCTQAGRPVACFDPDWGWLGANGCRYKPDPDPGDWLVIPAGHDPAGGAWYLRTCPRAGNLDESLDVVWLDNGDAPVLGAVLTEAKARLDLPAPTIRLSPPPPAAQIVHLPTWLWLDNPQWTQRVATATVPGLAVTATATPTRVVWATGDGGSVTCEGAGTAWTPGADPGAASPTCGHTYTTVSAPAAYRLRATITWTVTWAGSGGLGGTEPSLTSTATVVVAVTDSVALITSGDRP